MKGDHLSFKRASGVAILGLAMTVVLGVVVLVIGGIRREQSFMALASFILCGIPIWLTLAITFDQHRRERLEALEAESMEQSGVAGSSVFQRTGDDLLVAARRLAWMHKFLLPGVSLAIAALMIGLGWWYFRIAMERYQVLTADIQNVSHELPIALGVILAFVGFIFARFVSGMGKQKVWANLRAGSAHAVGWAVMGLGLAVAHVVYLAGSDTLFRYIQVVFPWILIILGAEIILNFILTIYRPRRPGEIPRPAYDSRILGFMAAPDKLAESIGGALNYQFGFDVTGSWFYQLLSRSMILLVAVGALVIWGMSFFAVVRPGEQGLRIRSGRLVGEPLQPGLVLKMPWPFEWVERKQTDTLHRLDLASPTPGDVKSLLWTNSHKVDEKYLIVQPSDADRAVAAVDARDPAAREGDERIKDLALVSVEVPLLYKVSDLKAYEAIGQDGMRDSRLKAVGRREVMKYLATQKMDDVLGAGRSRATEELRVNIDKAFEGMGVQVLFVGIAGVHPPTITAARFESVVESLQQREGSIEAARTEETNILTQAVGSVPLAKEISREIQRLNQMTGGDETEIIKQEQKIEDLMTRAGGRAAITIERAKADRWSLHMAARGRAERYEGQLRAYQAAPQIYLSHLYFDMLQRVMSEARVFLTPDDSGAAVEVRIDAQEEPDTGNLFRRATDPEAAP